MPDVIGSVMGNLGIGNNFIIEGVIKIIAWIIGFILFTVIVVVLVKWRKNKKNYCIPVTILIPRSDGKITDEIPAKGGYFKSSAVGGITTFRLKRKGLATIEIPPPSSRYLVGLGRHLYLVQKGMDDFEPVLPDSFRTVTTEQGEHMAVIDLKCVNQDATAWLEDNRENAKKRFTLHGLWEKYKDFIQITIFVFIVFLAIYIQWFGMKEFVEELARLVDVLAKQNLNVPQVS